MEKKEGDIARAAMKSVKHMIRNFKGIDLGEVHGTGGDTLRVSENKQIIDELDRLTKKIV